MTGNEKSYCLTATYDGACAQNTIERKQRTMIAEPLCIAQRGRYSDTGSRTAKGNGATEQYYEVRDDGKTNTLTTIRKDNAVVEPIRIGTIENNAKNKEFDSKQYRVYSPFSKSTTLCGEGGGVGAKTGLYAVPLQVPEATVKGYAEIKPGECVDLTQLNSKTRRGRLMREKSNCLTTSNEFYEYCGTKDHPIYEVSGGLITINRKTYPIRLVDGYYIIRKLTVAECRRLQTIPDWYKMPCSASQNYKMLGNGWTVDVISHILSFIPNLQSQSFEVLSMYDGMSCGRIALKNLGVNVSKYFATEIDKFAIKTTMANFPDTIYLGDAFNVRKSDFKIAQPEIKRESIKMVSGEQMTLF